MGGYDAVSNICLHLRCDNLMLFLTGDEGQEMVRSWENIGIRRCSRSFDTTQKFLHTSGPSL
jgi:hypothetical protein